MKKVLLALLALAASVAPSCNKQDTTTPAPLVSVTFAVGGYDSGYFPTRAMADAISATLPASLDLQLTNTATGVTYSAVTGQAVEIPTGTYSVTGGYIPESTKNIYGSAVYLSHSPQVGIDQEVEVVEGVTSYTLTAVYQSCALVTITAEVARWLGATSDREGFDVETMEDGIYSWTFLSGDLAESRYFHTYLTPADGSQQRSYTIIANPSMQMNFSDALVVAPGRWYILRASDAEIQSGGFSVEWPAWTQG